MKTYPLNSSGAAQLAGLIVPIVIIGLFVIFAGTRNPATPAGYVGYVSRGAILGKKEFVVLPYEEYVVLQERLADADDLMELRKAKRSQGKKNSIPLAEVKRQLGLR